MDKQAHWSHCCKKQNRTIQAWTIQSHKELDGYGYIWNTRTSGHTAQLGGGGRVQIQEHISVTDIQQTDGNGSSKVSEMWWEVLKFEFQKYILWPLYFHPSNLSSAPSLVAIFIALTLMKGEAAVAWSQPALYAPPPLCLMLRVTAASCDMRF